MATIRDVLPRTIDREKIVAACEALGIDPVGVRSLSIERDHVDVTVRMVIDGWRTEDPVPGEDDDG